MKRYLLAFFTALITLVANAANEAYFHVSNKFEAKAGETVELAVAMKNDKPILGFQTWITLPDGMTFNKVVDEDEEEFYDASLTSRKKSIHVLSVLTSAVGGVSIVGYASDGYTPFKGDDGDIFTIRVKIADDVTPGEYKIRMSNIAFTPNDMQEIDQDDFEVPITIYEDYSVNVEWDETKGTITGGGVYRGGTSVKLEATPNEGYHFVKWSNGITDNPYVFTAERDLSLNAEFDANEYFIKYFVDGVEDKTKTVSAKYGSTIEKAANPTKTGYTFSGWSEIPETMPAHDVEVNGSFTVNQYTLTFHLYEGAEPVVITQDYDSEVTPPANLTREGYTFTGWDKAVPAKMPAENMTFTAQWTINAYKLTYKVDGEVHQAMEYNYGSQIEKAANPTKTGYTFSGWSEIPETMPAHDVEVNGSFTVNQYTLTFHLYEGAEPIVITQDYDSEVTPPANLTREGYTFTGWDKAVPAKIPAENMTFTAQWTINAYKLTYKVDGEVHQAMEYNYGSQIEKAANPTKTGYTFSGWSEIPETMPAHDVEVNGSFTVNQYTLTFHLYEGAEPVVITQDYDSEVTPPANLTREGYTFTGWDKAVPAKMPAENMTFTAQWTINAYKLTYKVDGEVHQAMEFNYGSQIEKAANPTKTGYTFSGWSEIPETMPAHDVEVNGSFTVNQYTLTFHLYEGAEPVVITQDYDSEVTPPANLTREGYTFTGWDKAVPAKMPAENMTFTAQWTINAYKLTYLVDGEIYKEYDVDYGTEITPEADPIKEGYEFGGWEELPTTMPAHNVVVNGHFKVLTSVNKIVAVSDIVTVYDLNGRLIVRDVTFGEFCKKYPRGVYIVNGKKIVI